MPVAQLVEHRIIMREVVSSIPAVQTLRILKKKGAESAAFVITCLDFLFFSDKDYKPEVASHVLL